MPIEIQLHTPASEQAIDRIGQGLHQYNRSLSTIDEVEPLHLIASNDAGETAGGAVGRTWGACCELQMLWVDEALRGEGMGTRLMDAFEQEAKQRGCRLIFLDTFSFQAPGFYAKRGYREVMRISGFKGGEAKVYLQKSIDPGIA